MNKLTAKVRRRVAAKFFPDAVYLGALALAGGASTELHLYLGIACCGCIRPVADVQRFMHGASTELGPGLAIGNATEIVHEGFQHLVEAMRREPNLRAPWDLEDAIRQAAEDVRWYLREDLKGFRVERRRGLRDAALGAIVLLSRLIGEPPGFAYELMRESAECIADEELLSPSRDADFYKVLERT